MNCQCHKPRDDQDVLAGESHKCLSHLMPYSRRRSAKYSEIVLDYDIMRSAYT
jgi:hypothetical protein